MGARVLDGEQGCGKRRRWRSQGNDGDYYEVADQGGNKEYRREIEWRREGLEKRGCGRESARCGHGGKCVS